MPTREDKMKDFNPESGGHGKTKERIRGNGGKTNKRLGGKDKQKKGLGRKLGVVGTPTSSCQTRNQKHAMDTPVAASTRRGNLAGDLLTPGKRNPPWVFGFCKVQVEAVFAKEEVKGWKKDW
jgi:hypothetical protein